MSMPTEEELRTALAEAGRMREQGDDPHFIAKSLLNLNYQNGHLMEVLRLTDRFLRTGMTVVEHQKLKKAIENTRRAIERSGGIESGRFIL